MSREFVLENSKSRIRLHSLVERLSNEDLAKATPAGWTVSSLLAHLAFWDQRAVIVLRLWKETGVAPSPVDINVVNDAAKVLCLAIEGKRAAQLCLSSAGAFDSEAEAVNDGLLAEIQAKATQFRLSRAAHREEHLAEIEAIVSARE